MRSHACGSLRAADAGAEVRLAGWVARRRDHGGVAFLDLRDASGVVQVVVRPEQTPAAAAIRHEDCVRVSGTVRARPTGNENPELPTGEVEVAAAEVEVLAPSETPPFPLEGRSDADENLRLQYRYLDLRRPAARHGLELRARANATLRRVLADRGFLEVETPYLTKSTPEGARDFLVTTHLSPGELYALPQSPQLFKQLLMVAGVERYYQIVRCFRDEALRADRQPEFTQLD
ncbi:MAG TPA: amino acid--tRNA ligase-related protein, partial [Actinomycetota bacterium]|nr:amino acid--tRNA ligase-related protein [Actinomycetota bacterium]